MPLRRESHRLKLDFRGDARKAALWLVLGFHPLLETSCLKRALRDVSMDECWVKLFQVAFEIVEPAPSIHLAWKMLCKELRIACSNILRVGILSRRMAGCVSRIHIDARMCTRCVAFQRVLMQF